MTILGDFEVGRLVCIRIIGDMAGVGTEQSGTFKTEGAPCTAFET